MSVASVSGIYLAKDNLLPYLSETPLIPADSLSRPGHEVRLKLETVQPVGAFKIRGALNALLNLSDEELNRGVVCASTGNHGRALAYAARLLGYRATVCMSALVPENKTEAVRCCGAEIRIHGNSQDDAQLLVDELVSQQGMVEIPPFDHELVIAGQGTIGLEILDRWPNVDTLIVGLSGGGLLSGIALAAKSVNPNIRVIGVSPENGAAMAASVKAGKPVEVIEEATLADSLGGGIGLNNRYTFAYVQDLVDRVITIPELAIARAMRHLFLYEREVAEGAGALGAALLLDQQLYQQHKDVLGERIAIIVSGKNVDMTLFRAIIDQTHSLFNQIGR